NTNPYHSHKGSLTKQPTDSFSGTFGLKRSDYPRLEYGDHRGRCQQYEVEEEYCDRRTIMSISRQVEVHVEQNSMEYKVIKCIESHEPDTYPQWTKRFEIASDLQDQK